MAAKKSTAKKAAPKKAAPKKAAPKKAAPPKKTAAKKRAPAKKSAVAKSKNGVPPGFHTITPNLVYKDTVAAIDWYKKVFGATELSRMPAPDGKSIWHAEIKIGDSILYMNDESPRGATVAPSGPRTGTAAIQLYVADVDAWVARAAEHGAQVVMPVADQFWGDRMSVIVDPFGHVWMISTRTKDMTHEEMAAAGAEFAKQMAAQQAQS